MKLIVPDASVLLKWVLPEEREPYTAQALAIRDAFLAGRIGLLVPPLWFYEVGNVLVTHYPESAMERLAALAALQVPEARPNPAWRERIIQLSRTYQATFYDAAYHALAIVNRALFVTADEKYLRKVDSDPHALSLSQWPSSVR